MSGEGNNNEAGVGAARMAPDRRMLWAAFALKLSWKLAHEVLPRGVKGGGRLACHLALGN